MIQKIFVRDDEDDQQQIVIEEWFEVSESAEKLAITQEELSRLMVENRFIDETNALNGEFSNQYNYVCTIEFPASNSPGNGKNATKLCLSRAGIQYISEQLKKEV